MKGNVLPFRNRIVSHGEMPANQFLANPLNARRHPNAQRDVMRGILDEVGFVQGVIVSKRTGVLLDGHLRIEEALTRDENQPIPYVEVDVSEAEERVILAGFDPITAMASYDKETLDLLLKEVSTGDAAVEKMLADLARDNGLQLQEVKADRPTLADRFVVPPFSVLDARQGYWQERKRAWVDLGIQSELGRGGGLTMSAEQVTTENLNYYRNRQGGGRPDKL